MTAITPWLTKTNRDQRRIIRDKAMHMRHEAFADDVLALLDDHEMFEELLRQAMVYTEGDLRTTIRKALRVG